MPLLPGSELAAAYCPRIPAAAGLLVMQGLRRLSQKGPDQAPSKVAFSRHHELQPLGLHLCWWERGRKEKPEPQL